MILCCLHVVSSGCDVIPEFFKLVLLGIHKILFGFHWIVSGFHLVFILCYDVLEHCMVWYAMLCCVV